LLDGGDLATLADILGHSSVEITKRFYAIFDVGHLQEMHAKHSPVAKLGGNGDDD
jgi:site-specific recombinase XerD